MPEIRLIGGVIGLVTVVVALVGLTRHRKKGVLRLRDISILAVGVGLLVLAIFPRSFDAVAGLFGVDSLEGRRVAILTTVGFAMGMIALFVVVGRLADLHQQVGDLAVELAGRTPVFERLSRYPDRFIAVVLPAYNEEDALPGVLTAMPTDSGRLPILTVVVSDGSTDGTVEAAVPMADVVLERPLRRGSGAAIRTGIAFALRQGAEVVVTLDADGQHDPREIDLLVDPLLSGAADLTQGARMVNSGEVSGDYLRAIGVVAFGWMLRSFAGIDTSDPSNGFRAFTAEGYRLLQLSEDQFYVGEFVVRSARANLRIVEVPVTVSSRTHGQSKKPGSVLYGFGFARSIIRALLRRPQNKV